MTDHDDKLARAYRDLPREEPPARLDAAILAAARREVAPRSFVQRWRVPVSLAAVLVLAIGITLELQHQEPGIETSLPSAAAPAPAPSTPAPEMPAPQSPPAAATRSEAARSDARAAAKANEARDAARHEAPARPVTKMQVAPQREAPGEPPPAFIPPAAPPSAAAPSLQAAPARAAPVESAAPPPALSTPAATAPSPSSFAAPEAKRARSAADANVSGEKAVASDPVAELERIAHLRHAGLDEEADRALEAFRRRHPDYRIDEDLWQRVKPR